ncbi:MAG TPA: hypothetical protein VE173_01005, partial [Longimicrobiales bacterium]|nr:hypothetical protein [Longimicrobiales bacterium]
MLLEEPVAGEPAQDPAADGLPKGLDVRPGEGRGLVDPDAACGRILPLSLLGRFIHAVQDAEVVVEMGI